MYFEKPGKENTQKAIELAVKAAKEKNIKTIVISSSTGDSLKYLEKVSGTNDLNIVCVTHAYGYPSPGKNDMPDDTRAKLIAKGYKLLTTTHLLSGAERGLSSKFGGVCPIEIMANTLRMFSQGTKVCVEISVMAVDSGLAPYMEPIIAIGGTCHGLDTAMIIKASHAGKILDTQIEEIICKPLL